METKLPGNEAVVREKDGFRQKRKKMKNLVFLILRKKREK